MESVKSIGKDVVYGKSKIHTNMEFTFSNNKKFIKFKKGLEIFYKKAYNVIEKHICMFIRQT